MNKDELKESLTKDEVTQLLSELGAQNFTYLDSKDAIITNTICHNISEGSMKLYYYNKNKSFRCYTHCSDDYFDIYELVIRSFALRDIKYSFADALQWVATQTKREVTGRNSVSVDASDSVFGDLTMMNIEPPKELLWLNKKLSKKKMKENEYELVRYSDKILTLFEEYYHSAFLNDNISVESMKKFEILFYSYQDKIIIPHRYYETGEIIGIKARNLKQSDVEKGFKYLPMKVRNIQYSYPTHYNLYGLFQNKETIKKYRKIIVFESEKSVLQFETYFPNQNIAVAISGSSISQRQIDMILQLRVEEVILALDKEYVAIGDKKYTIHNRKVQRIAKLIKSYCKTSQILDTENLLEEKDSPSDKGAETLKKLINSRQLL